MYPRLLFFSCPRLYLSGLPLVSQKDLKRLYKRFQKLDKDNSGTITTDEFLMVPELAMNPLVERVIAIFDINKDESINFKEFIQALSVFSVNGAREHKLRCTVKLLALI